jgi:hypothetical protein
MSESIHPEPNFSLSSAEMLLVAPAVLERAKATVFAFPGAQEKWEAKMAEQEGRPVVGFLDLRSTTVDGRLALVSYFQAPTHEQIEVRVFKRPPFYIGLFQSEPPLERESIFVAVNSNPQNDNNASSVFYEKGTKLSYQNSKTAVNEGNAALKRMANPEPAINRIAEAINTEFFSKQTLLWFGKQIGATEPITSWEELEAELAKRSKPDHEGLSREERMKIFQEFEQQEKQEILRLDWTPEFIRRWKMLIDGIEDSNTG